MLTLATMLHKPPSTTLRITPRKDKNRMTSLYFILLLPLKFIRNSPLEYLIALFVTFDVGIVLVMVLRCRKPGEGVESVVKIRVHGRFITETTVRMLAARKEVL
jgi:hypothetical protein